MAVERKVDSKSAITSSDTPKKAPAKTAKPAKATGPMTPDRIRAELEEARRKHAMEKLESPNIIKKLRKDLARALTAERAKAQPKETV
ncbi:50S ribosomal protein L29 [Patescibacteria group bacterium]|nr:50S ribosomal protein L29 [Patescibacteria group bacterium]